MQVEACSTKMVGICSCFLFEVLLLISSPCLYLLLKKIANWLCHENGDNTGKNKLLSQLLFAVAVVKGYVEFLI